MAAWNPSSDRFLPPFSRPVNSGSCVSVACTAAVCIAAVCRDCSSLAVSLSSMLQALDLPVVFNDAGFGICFPGDDEVSSLKDVWSNVTDTITVNAQFPGLTMCMNKTDCDPSWIGNGRCDPACNTTECLFDGQDCRVTPQLNCPLNPSPNSSAAGYFECSNAGFCNVVYSYTNYTYSSSHRCYVRAHWMMLACMGPRKHRYVRAASPSPSLERHAV